MKKIIAGLLAVLTVFSMIGCSGETDNNNSSSSGKPEVNTLKYDAISDDNVTKKLSTNETFEIKLDYTSKKKNYIKISFNTDTYLTGSITYCNADNEKETTTEDFFIQEGETEFKQFLDAYRKNGKGKYENKKITSLKFKNVSSKECNFNFKGLFVADRNIPEFEQELYITKDDLKVGVDLATGGTLTYLARTDYNGMSLDEVLLNDNNVAIGLEYDEKSNVKESISKGGLVNLINNYDAGRQFQQSYYADIGGSQAATNGENGYTRAFCYTGSSSGYYWPYNPVQGGNYKSLPSQIIDYEVKENQIYVKVRAMDWAQEDSTTKSYIENWYTIENGLVKVTNRFTDWNGFTDMDKIATHNFELPATYVVYPFYTFVSYTGNNPWTNENVYDKSSYLGSWKNGSHQSRNHKEDWFAWVNAEEFGVGMYVPNMTYYASGRSEETCNINAASGKNKRAYESPIANNYLYNKEYPRSPYEGTYNFNTCYTAPVRALKMREYEPLTYQYALAVDFIEVMREQFKTLHENGEMKNETLDKWA